MKMSELLIPTLREIPAEAEVTSHKLMLRAGLLRKVSTGMYSYLPLGRRVVEKVTRIVREEMDAKGGQEVLLPMVQPAELWRETGRWDVYGDEMFKLKDRYGREYCLGPTHEEIMTDLVLHEVRSYRQLPLLLYQIQNKYRDEIRPRFGVMRSRDFIMKDLYSFDRDEAGLDVSYEKMYDAYCRVFERCGLDSRVVEADPGAIGGTGSHEYMVTAAAGEAEIAYCPDCSYAANTEKAEGDIPDAAAASDPAATVPAMESIATPGVHTIEELSAFLSLPASKLVKTILYEAVNLSDSRFVAVLIRGDQEVNEVKLQNLLGCLHLQLADEAAVRRLTGAPVGFAGPVGLNGAELIADLSVLTPDGAVTGGNAADLHLKNVVCGRDYQPDKTADLRLVHAGDRCRRCGQELKIMRGIEVGHIFKLGTKYSKPLHATFLDEAGTELPAVMGCYGIGITRTVAAAIEQNHDDRGIIWPVSIAPYHVVIVPISWKDPGQRELTEDLARRLQGYGIEVLIDDRDERPGVKFKDAELIGIPFRVTIGQKAVADGMLELRERRTDQDHRLDKESLVAWLKDAVPGNR